MSDSAGIDHVKQSTSWIARIALVLLALSGAIELANLILSGVGEHGSQQKIVAGIAGLCVTAIIFVVAPISFGYLVILKHSWPKWVLGAIALLALAIQVWAITVTGSVRATTAIFTIALILGTILIWISAATAPQAHTVRT